jgi:hypothetical protein
MGFMKGVIRVGFARPVSVLCAVAVCLAAGASSGWAQTSTAGTVAGQVTDQQNAAVPGAQVRVIDTSTGATQTTVTNDTGRYIFSQVPPGKYNITFSKEGFSNSFVAAQPVDVGAVLTINADWKWAPSQRR